MPTMQTIGGSIVPPRCLACLLLVLSLLPVAVPASGEGRAPGAVSWPAEACERKVHSLLDVERPPTDRRAVRTDDCPEWYRREKERLASLDFEERAALRWLETWDAAKSLLLVAVVAIFCYYSIKIGAPARVAMRCGKMLLVIWTDRGDGEEDLRRQEAAKERYRKYMAEHPRQSCMLIRQELPIFVKWGKRLVRRWRAWRGTEAAASWAAESEEFTAGLLADMAALDPKKKLKGASGKSGMPSGGKAAPGKTGGHGPGRTDARRIAGGTV